VLRLCEVVLHGGVRAGLDRDAVVRASVRRFHPHDAHRDCCGLKSKAVEGDRAAGRDIVFAHARDVNRDTAPRRRSSPASHWPQPRCVARFTGCGDAGLVDAKEDEYRSRTDAGHAMPCVTTTHCAPRTTLCNRQLLPLAFFLPSRLSTLCRPLFLP
jgi:hypothetical protein